MSLREKLKAKPQRATKSVIVQGDEYLLRSLTLKEQGENDLLAINKKSRKIEPDQLGRQQCDLLCRCVCDPETKEPVFSVSEWQEWESIAAPITSRLLIEIRKLNDGEEVEEMLGNYESTGD